MRVQHIIALPIALASSIAGAQSSFIARCSEPVGMRFDQVNGDTRQKEDGYSGVNPTFFFSADAPRKVTYLWGPAAWARDAMRLRENLQEAIVIQATAEKLTAVRIEPDNVSQLYSLYPSKGIVYFTQHRFIAPHTGGVPSSSSFYARCEFFAK